MITNEAFGQGDVLRQRRSATRFLDVVGNLLAGGHELPEALRRIAGHRLERLSDHQVMHARTVRRGTIHSCSANPVAAGVRRALVGRVQRLVA